MLLDEEEYYEISCRHGWNKNDYKDWYIDYWSLFKIRTKADLKPSKYYKELIAAEAAKEIREKVRLLQEALDV